MRANEFIAEGIGDWFDKSSRAAVAKKHAAAQKANTPKIAKAIIKLLGLKINELFGKADANETEVAAGDIERLVLNVLHRSLKVDPTTGDLKEPADEIVASIVANPEGFKNDVSVKHNVEAITQWSFAREIDHPGQSNKKSFKAEVVFVPGSERFDNSDNAGEQLAYTEYNGTWSEWIRVTSKIWEFKRKINSSTEKEALDQLKDSPGSRPKPHSFVKYKDDYYKVS